MKCQFCNKDRVDRVFYINWTGTVYQVPVCADCLQKMWNQAAATGKTEEFKNYTGWVAGASAIRDIWETAHFLKRQYPGLIRRRRLAALRIRLTEAAETENYEEAAKLRDDIAVMEKEVCTHGN